MHNLCFGIPILFADFNFTEETKATIVAAKQKFKEVTESLDMNYLQIHNAGKDYIKKSKLGPDSFVQLAIQVQLSEKMIKVRKKFWQ